MTLSDDPDLVEGLTDSPALNLQDEATKDPLAEMLLEALSG